MYVTDMKALLNHFPSRYVGYACFYSTCITIDGILIPEFFDSFLTPAKRSTNFKPA